MEVVLVPAITGRILHRPIVAVLLWLVLAAPAWPTPPKQPESVLFTEADVVAIATPIDRRVVNDAAFIPRTNWGGDSIPVVAVETRFRVRLCLKGTAEIGSTFVLIHYLRREKPDEPVRIGEGNMTVHTARSTAFPQPAPGAADKPGPMIVPTEQLRGMLGLTSVTYVVGTQDLAITDSTLG